MKFQFNPTRAAAFQKRATRVETGRLSVGRGAGSRFRSGREAAIDLMGRLLFEFFNSTSYPALTETLISRTLCVSKLFAACTPALAAWAPNPGRYGQDVRTADTLRRQTLSHILAEDIEDMDTRQTIEVIDL